MAITFLMLEQTFPYPSIYDFGKIRMRKWGSKGLIGVFPKL